MAVLEQYYIVGIELASVQWDVDPTGMECGLQ